MLLFGYRLQLWQCIEAGCLMAPHRVPLLGLCLLLGYRYDYAIHGSPYMFAHVQIENTLVHHKTDNSRIALCYQNRVSKGTNQCYGLCVSACISVHSALVTVLGLLKKKNKEKKELVQNGVFAIFRLAT